MAIRPSWRTWVKGPFKSLGLSDAYMRHSRRQTRLSLVQIMTCRHQAIIWTNVGLLSIEPLRTNLSEVRINIRRFSFRKMWLKTSFVKWRPFYLGLNLLNLTRTDHITVAQRSTIKPRAYFVADSRFAPSQWETSLQSNAVSHWLGANLESAPYFIMDMQYVPYGWLTVTDTWPQCVSSGVASPLH